MSLRCNSHRKGIASQRYRKKSSLTGQKLTSMGVFTRKKWRRGFRLLTNAALRPGMPPCPSLWVVFGTIFTHSTALRNFNGGSPTSSTTDWHLASFSSSAFRSRSDLPNSLAFLALASCSVISFSYLAAFSCFATFNCLATFSCLVAFSCTSDW